MNIDIHNLNNLPLIDYRTVKPLQGKLKTLTPTNYQKLKRVLEKRGFTVPLFVWLEQKNVDGQIVKSHYLMDGHGRQKVMLGENAVPYEVPYILIEADNIREAKAQLLEITSQYNTVTREGFEDFTADMEAMEFEDTSFDALELVGVASPEDGKQGKNDEDKHQIIISFIGDNVNMDLENCLVEIQEVCERYASAQIKVNE